MAKSGNQKLKILYIYDYLMRCSDEDHTISTRQIISYLDGLGILAERKSIYADIDALRYFGADIIKSGGQNAGYYVASRNFELPELKLLVDAVQSSKFITQKKSYSLIKKIESLCSEYEAKLLQGQVIVANRIKTMNESIYYNVDEIHGAIAANRQIAFKYFEYSVTKERVLRKNGTEYVVSPAALTWDDENYYMIAYDGEAGMIKHYRVDKMTGIRLTDDERRSGALLSASELADYSSKVFGMFTGAKESVRIRFRNHLVGAVIDRFGSGVSVIPDGNEHFTVTVEVVTSPQFMAWVFAFGGEAEILSPESVVDKMRTQLAETSKNYAGTDGAGGGNRK